MAQSKYTPPTAEDAYAALRDLITSALDHARSSEGYFSNVRGKLKPNNTSVSTPDTGTNILLMGLHSDQHGYETNQYLKYGDIRAQGLSLKQGEYEKPVAYLCRNWTYEHRFDPNKVLSSKEYKELPEEERKLYKGRNNEVTIQPIYNLDQTNMGTRKPADYEELIQKQGTRNDRGYIAQEDNRLRHSVNMFIDEVSKGAVPIMRRPGPAVEYKKETGKLLVPPQSNYESYADWHGELVRGVVSVLGQSERLGRLDVDTERLIVHLSAAEVMMSRFGQPYKIPDTDFDKIERWINSLQSNPNLIKHVESEVNRIHEALETIHRGEKYVMSADHTVSTTEDLSEGRDVDSDRLELKRIYAQGTLPIPLRVFKDPETESAFWAKHPDLAAFNQRVHDLVQLIDTENDSKTRMGYYKELNAIQLKFDEAVIDKISQGKATWTHYVADSITAPGTGLVDKHGIVIVVDKDTRETSVIVQSGAYPSGAQPKEATREQIIKALTDGSTQLRTIIPPAELDDKQKAGMTPEQIDAAETEKIIDSPFPKASDIRFFETAGELSYDPSDVHFVGKEIYTVNIDSAKSRATLEKFDWESAFKSKVMPLFETEPWAISNSRDGRERYALMFVPADGSNQFFMYLDRKDQNAMFDALKKNPEQREAIKSMYIRNYFIRSQVRPDLKIPFTPAIPETVDKRLIEHGPSIYVDEQKRPYMYMKLRGMQAESQYFTKPNYDIIMHSREDVAATYKLVVAGKIFSESFRKAAELNKEWLESQPQEAETADVVEEEMTSYKGGRHR